MPLDKKERTRPLAIKDLVKGSEFVMAQTTDVERPGSTRRFILRVGDVITIEGVNPEDCRISVNGRLKSTWDRLRVPLSEIGDLIVENPE